VAFCTGKKSNFAVKLLVAIVGKIDYILICLILEREDLSLF